MVPSRLTAWMAIAGRFGSVQTLLILALFYGMMIGPVSLGLWVARRDHLGKGGLRSGGSENLGYPARSKPSRGRCRV